MSQIIQTYASSLPLEEPARFRWKVLQYENLFSMGLLPHGSFELLHGDVIEKMPTKYPHAHVVTLLFALLSRFFGFPTLLTQFSLYINDENLPEPDFAVLKSSAPSLTDGGHVRAEDVQLIIEVSDATLSSDLTTKAVLYAGAGIPEYWVVDVNGRCLIIHDSPHVAGYTQVITYSETETASPRSFPTCIFPVSEILP